MSQGFRDLEVWRESLGWVKRVYRLAATFPDQERFGLVGQIQRAAVSVPANVAEGAARDHTKEFLRYLSIARGSLAEVETMILLAIELEYVMEDQCKDLIAKTHEIGRMLTGLQRAMKQKLST